MQTAEACLSRLSFVLAEGSGLAACSAPAACSDSAATAACSLHFARTSQGAQEPEIKRGRAKPGHVSFALAPF